MNQILKDIQNIGIVPVVVLDDAKDAEPLAQALCKGGLPCAEVTFRTSAAEESIRLMSNKFPNMLIGAGTVLTTEQVDRAVNAGAKFIVSPGLNPEIVKYCLDNEIPVVPGVTNPTNIEKAIELGLDVVKFFPAEAAGGLKMIKAMSAPYTNMKFMPTGGINTDNINEYLSFERIIACGGSWMVKSDLIKEGKFKEIEEITRKAVMKMHGFKMVHVGINFNSEKEALAFSFFFSSIFGFENVENDKTIFTSQEIECLKKPYLGKNGHLGIETNNIERSIVYLKSKGITVDMDNAIYKDKKLFVVYLKDEIFGYAIHLVQKNM